MSGTLAYLTREEVESLSPAHPAWSDPLTVAALRQTVLALYDAIAKAEATISGQVTTTLGLLYRLQEEKDRADIAEERLEGSRSRREAVTGAKRDPKYRGGRPRKSAKTIYDDVSLCPCAECGRVRAGGSGRADEWPDSLVGPNDGWDGRISMPEVLNWQNPMKSEEEKP